jgi:pimeloyl-ACP methyl ester carboxylesterase
MRTLGVLLFAVLGITGVLFFGPREKLPADLPKPSEELQTALKGDINAYLETAESAYTDMTVGVHKRVIWAGEAGAKTAVSVVNIHGFSATSEEIRPVPDNVASALGANLVYTRLTGHGLSGDAMGTPTGADWLADFVEAMAIARAVGDKVIVLTTSTGGTIAAAATMYENALDDVAGIVFVSPNFATHNKASVLGRLPYARVWAKWLAGERVSWKASNELHEKFWTTSYPPHSIVPMMTFIAANENIDFTKTDIPALFYYSLDDLVVVPAATKAVVDQWGGATTIINPTMGENDDANSHVIAGDIVSPSQTGPASVAITEWVNGL